MPPPTMAPPPAPVRATPITCPAERYYFDMRTKVWKKQDTLVRILNPSRGFEAGGMRICFEVQEVDESGFGSDCVAKFFRKNIQNVVEADYFNEGAAQCLSEEFAENFNKKMNEISRDATPEMRQTLPSLTMRISFLMCHVVKIKWNCMPDAVRARHDVFGRESFFTFRTQDTREVMFVMEPKLRGEFTKYNSNFGEIYESADARKQLTPEQQAQRHAVFKLAEAFSHFSLKETAGSMLVCDLQGVKDFFTDPQIHTEDGKGLGMGNMGQEGIDKWVQSHHCNDYCNVLGLAARGGLQGPPAPAQPPSRYAELRTHAQPTGSRAGPASILPLPEDSGSDAASPHSPQFQVEFVDDGTSPLVMQNQPPPAAPAQRPPPNAGQQQQQQQQQRPAFQPPPALYGGPTGAPVNYHPPSGMPPPSGYVPINHGAHQPVVMQGIPLQQQGFQPNFPVPPPGYPAPSHQQGGYSPPPPPQQHQQAASPNGGAQKPVGQMTYEEQLEYALRMSTLNS